MQTDRIIREPAVNDLTGLSRTTRWRLERAGKFPARRKLSENAVGWFESEIHEWIVTRNISREPTSNSHHISKTPKQSDHCRSHTSVATAASQKSKRDVL